MLSTIGPAIVDFRSLMLQQPVDRDFMIRTIDQVVLPAAGLRPNA